MADGASGTSSLGCPRILVARPDHLGDVLLTLGAAAALRRTFPAFHLAYTVSPMMRQVVEHCPYVDDLHLVPFPPPNAVANPPGWAETVIDEASKLHGKFDVGLVMRPDDPWSGALLAAAAIPVRLGYDLPRTRSYLTLALPQPPGRHVVLLALRLAAAASNCLGRDLTGSPEPPLAGCFVPRPEEVAEAEQILNEAGTSPIILHPGSGRRLKNWPTRCWGELAAALTATYGTPPLVLGGPGEHKLVEAVVAASGRHARGLADRPSLGGLAALHRLARLVIGTDSGALHLATMMGAPVIGLYGPADPVMFAPWAAVNQSRVLRVPLSCSPCGTLEQPPCGALIEPACITALQTEAVLAASADLLGLSNT